MFGLDYILASHLVLASAGNDIKCVMKAAPEITVSAKGLDRPIDHTKTIRQLNAFKPFTGKSPYADDTQTYIQGLAKGGVNVQGQYQFGTETYPTLQMGCLYTTKIQVTISLDSSILIAKEYKKGTCQYKAVLEHELKHRAVDRELVNKYSTIIAKAANSTLKTLGYAQGPFPVAQIPAAQEKISATLSSVISQFGDKFSEERNKRQEQVDSLSEYERVHNLCKDWPQPVL